MHPRNPLHGAMDFNALAKSCESLRNVCSWRNGKVVVDFSSDEVVRELTKAILSRFFNLIVELPPGSLCPRIPQRMNYLLWMEDCLLASSVDPSDVIGIDIGSGASCVFSLLGARHFKWRMHSSEVEEESLVTARSNVLNNSLQSSITLHKVSGESIIQEVLREMKEESATFCVCNPPFFDQFEAEERFDVEGETCSNKLRLVAAPHSSTVAKANEVRVEGGEVGFTRRLIAESVVEKNRVRIFSTMLGKKESVSTLCEDLRELGKSEGDARHTTHAMRQGRTTRWLLAWTFHPRVALDSHTVLQLHVHSSTAALQCIREEFGRLGISMEEEERAIRCSAQERNWLRKGKRRSSDRVLRFSVAAKDGEENCIFFHSLQRDKQIMNTLVMYLSHRICSIAEE